MGEEQVLSCQHQRECGRYVVVYIICVLFYIINVIIHISIYTTGQKVYGKNKVGSGRASELFLIHITHEHSSSLLISVCVIIAVHCCNSCCTSGESHQ